MPVAKLMVVAIAGFLAVIGLCEVEFPGEPIAFDEFAGVYSANFGHAVRDCIIVEPDSTYTHYYRVGDSTVVERGTYSFHESRGFYHAGFKDFRVYFPRWVHYLIESDTTKTNHGDTLSRHGHCYYADHGTLDTTRFVLAVNVYKSEDGSINLQYCPERFQYYVKLDDREEAETRQELRELMADEMERDSARTP